MAKPQIPDVIERFSVYKKIHPIWGSLHIVLDESNVKDKHVEFCKQWAMDHNDHEGIALAELLLQMSKSQRSRIDRKVDEFNNKGE